MRCCDGGGAAVTLRSTGSLPTPQRGALIVSSGSVSSSFYSTATIMTIVIMIWTRLVAGRCDEVHQVVRSPGLRTGARPDGHPLQQALQRLPRPPHQPEGCNENAVNLPNAVSCQKQLASLASPTAVGAHARSAFQRNLGRYKGQELVRHADEKTHGGMRAAASAAEIVCRIEFAAPSCSQHLRMGSTCRVDQLL